MQKIIYPGTICGSITAPPSKSVTQRALLAAVIRRGRTILYNAGDSDDERAMLGVAGQLGAVVKPMEPGVWSISSGGRPAEAGAFHFGESGLAIRMAAPVIALLHGGRATLAGEGSLMSRPISWLEQTLPRLGVTVQTTAGRLPAVMQGRLVPKDIQVDGSFSSQFISGLLFAFAAGADRAVTLSIRNPVSRAYLDLTVSVLRDFGFLINTKGPGEYVVYAGNCLADSPLVEYLIDGDWSSAAIWLAAAASTGADISLGGLRPNSAQADRAILEPLYACGAAYEWMDGNLLLHRRGAPALQPFRFDATNCPDLFPPLAVLAAACEGASVIQGIHRLVYKESNRALSLQSEFERMGIRVELDVAADTMAIVGGRPGGHCMVSSHGDHRIAMACAALALRADGPVTIDGAEAVAKSYPAFWDALERMFTASA